MGAVSRQQVAPPVAPLSRKRRRLLLAIVTVLGATAIGIGAFLVRAEIQARADHREALAAIDRRDFKLALNHLERCREAWPTIGEIAFLTARTARRAGEFKVAERLINEAERLGWAEQAIFLERALQLAQQGGFAEAEPYLLMCVRDDHADSNLILEVIAPYYANAFSVAKASEMLAIWIRREPNHPTPFILKGDISKRLGRKTDTLTSYQEACRLAPDNPEARDRFADALVATKGFREAIEHLDWLIQHGHAHRGVYLNLARCRAVLGEEAEARLILDRLYQEYAHDAQVLSERASFELDAGNPREAETWFVRAAELEPNDFPICFNYARCLEQLGKADEARKYRDRCKQIEESLRRMEKLMQAISARPRDPELRREAGTIMIQNGKVQEGIRWLETALKQDPNHGPTHAALADHYLLTGDTARADFHRRRLLETPR
jgi:predicted Zn-dependent protease